MTFRSKGLIDVALVAKHFGGGGHKQASGCKMEVPLKEAQEKVVSYVLEKINAALEKKKKAVKKAAAENTVEKNSSDKKTEEIPSK